MRPLQLRMRDRLFGYRPAGHLMLAGRARTWSPPPVLWTPANFTTALWLDAADSMTITLDESNKVSQWDDKSGNDWHATQGTLAWRPLYVSNVLNGNAIVRFNGTSTRLACSLLNLSQPFSVYFVGQTNVVTGSSGSRQFIFDGLVGAANRCIFSLRGQQINKPSMWAGTVSTWDSFSSQTTTAYTLYEGIFNVSSSIIGVNAVREMIKIDGNNLKEGIVIGAHNDQSMDFLNGDIAEIIFVSGTLSTENRQIFEGYLAHKWGLEGSLPGEHPYRSSPPYNK